MEHYKNLSDNLKVLGSMSCHNPEGPTTHIIFECQFFGQIMNAIVKVSATEETEWGTITGEGDAELWDSFADQLENTHWATMCQLVKAHLKEEQE